MKSLFWFSMSFLILMNSCEDKNLTDLETRLISLLDSDDVTGVDGFDTNGDAELDFETGLETQGAYKNLSDTLVYEHGYKIRFGRQITDKNRTVEFEIGSDTAIGLVNYNVNGVLTVKSFDTTDNIQIDSMSFSKDFSTTFVRKVRFVQIDNPSEPDGFEWKINALTPLVGGSGDKVTISNISIYELTDAMEKGALLHQFNANGIENLFINRESLPVFSAYSHYVIEVSVNNAGPELSIDTTNVGEWVFKNYGRRFNMRGRKHLNDKGAILDSILNDNIHTGGWRAHGPGLGLQRRGFRSFFETVDLATIFVEGGGYNTSIWSIPYKTQRP